MRRVESKTKVRVPPHNQIFTLSPLMYCPECAEPKKKTVVACVLTCFCPLGWILGNGWPDRLPARSKKLMSRWNGGMMFSCPTVSSARWTGTETAGLSSAHVMQHFGLAALLLVNRMKTGPSTNRLQHAPAVKNWNRWWVFGQHAAAAISPPFVLLCKG